MHQKLSSPWIMHIKRLLDHCGLSYMYHDEVAHTDPAEVVLSVKERLNDQFIQKWRAELSSSSKMRTYRLFKLDLHSEKYLTLLPHLRSILAKFRLSCHSLAIETGRYTRPPLPPEERVCQVCNVTEDEKHFLLQCPTTCSLPEFQSLMTLANNYIPNFIYLPLDTQFSTLMSSHHQQIIHNIARLLYVAFNHRQ